MPHPTSLHGHAAAAETCSAFTGDGGRQFLSGTAVKYAIIAVNNMLMTSRAFGYRLADG